MSARSSGPSSAEATASPPETLYTESERLQALQEIQQANLQSNPQNVRVKKRGSKRPSSRLSKRSTPAPGSGENLYCICRKPDDGTWMIGCDFCDEWYHGSCVKISQQFEELLVKFACPACTKAGKGMTQWQRKCRLDGCNKPVFREDSGAVTKYCSPEHGVEFFQRLLEGRHALGYVVGVDEFKLKQLADKVDTVEELKAMGQTLPARPQFNDSNENNNTNRQELEKYNEQKERIESEKAEWNLRLKYLKLAKERTKRVSEELASELGAKRKDVCGMDNALLEQDNATIKRTNLDAELPGREGLCLEDKRKCFKHRDWIKMLTAEAELHIQLCDNKMAQLDGDYAGIQHYNAVNDRASTST